MPNPKNTVTQPEHVNLSSPRASLEDLNVLGEHLSAMMGRLKQALYKPDSVKHAPKFNAAQLAALCGKKPAQMLRLLEQGAKKGLPTGLVIDESGAKVSAHRSFNLDEAIEWVRAVGNASYKRTQGQPGAVITVGFFKGGVGKTVISASLAQGLSLKGYRVLAIDFDPQGSLSAMLGVDPSTVEIQETFAPLAMLPDSEDRRDTLVESIRPTYWNGVDIIAGSTGLFECEFYLPLRAMNAQAEGQRFNFLEVLSNALKLGIRDEYDYIIIDTPPAISYTTMNAYWAADAILMPVVPEGLSLQSSVQFWEMFGELTGVAQNLSNSIKDYAWLGVVPSKVEAHKSSAQEMLKWIRMFYGQYVMATEIPQTEAVKTGGTEFNTVFDISKYVGSQKTYERAREAFDRLVNEVDMLTRKKHWNETAGE
ncbi:hypothetical protein CBP36_20035 (plasmid) [Acidovorax carolinensis]|jgi:chromosome partitioning protein|uniref:AAA domain-containing protein n=1 Tax=Acidovorax carolinensis TaxID=553814 RepID=A0A240UJQ9_9BURK|nr:AAA family ATPase [Acidovorax carolinensis]ART57203.1 hypothetical protein CBP35_20015 [Acidovorax carolinensis]ART61259.1 hypothetical protein CBP36_20035 [Acidovorax carolinensis]